MTTRCAPQVGALGSRVDRTCVEHRRNCTHVRSEHPHGRVARAPARGVARAPATRSSTAASGVGNRLFAGSFLVAAVALAVLADAERPFSPVARAAVRRRLRARRERRGLGRTANAVPTQIVFVPMLLLLPTPLVPLLVAAATVLTRRRRRPCAGRGAQAQRARDRRRVVQRRAGARADRVRRPARRLEHWWVYALALAAQLLDRRARVARAHVGAPAGAAARRDAPTC